MIGLTAIVITGLLLGGCALAPSSTPPTPSTAPPGSVTAVPSAPPPTETVAPPSPGESADAGGTSPDAATFLQVCARWPDDVEGDPIPCDELVAAVFAGPAVHGRVARVDTGYGCVTADTCGAPSPDRGYVLVPSASGTVEVEVARGADGTARSGEAVAVAAPERPFFVPPPASAPPIDGAPAAVNDRAPLPHCGTEAGVPYGPFDTDARQCFWDGLRSGSAVEFIESFADTEGRPTTMVYRYAGTGGVEVIYNDEGGWWRMHSGVEPAPRGRVFGLAGLSTPSEPIEGG